jgi:hypothetical protein
MSSTSLHLRQHYHPRRDRTPRWLRQLWLWC